MKKRILAALFAGMLTTQWAAGTATITFGMGNMFSNIAGPVPLPVGALINLLALDSGTWTGTYPNLTNALSTNTASFTLPGTTLVGRIGNNDDSGPGIASGLFQYTYNGAFNPGDQLLIVVYANRTTNSVAPGIGADGFFFRTDLVADLSDSAYVAPPDGSNVTMQSYTFDLGGSFPNDQFVAGAGSPSGSGSGFTGGGFTTIPEPSTYALLAMAAAALGGYVIRRRNSE